MVNLTKGQTIYLTKDGTIDSLTLKKVFFGAKWGQINHGITKRVERKVQVGTEEPKGFFRKLFKIRTPIYETKTEEVLVHGFTENVDLDASLLIYDCKNSLIDTVYFGNKCSKDYAISHSGDDITGTAGNEKEADNETISIDLPHITSKAKFVVAILNSYRHHKFDEIPYMKLRIYTGNTGNPDEVLCEYNLENNQTFKGKEAIVLGYFYRFSDGWKFKADGTTSKETSIHEIAKGTALEVISNHGFSKTIKKNT